MSSELMLNPEEITNIVKDIVETILQQDEYEASKVQKWQEQIVEETIRRVQMMRKPYKYMVSCSIMQKSGAGIHVGCSANCDNADGFSMTRVDVRAMYCIVVVVGSSLTGA